MDAWTNRSSMFEWKPAPHLDPVARLRSDLEFAADDLRPVPHGMKALVRLGLILQAAAVVFYRQQEIRIRRQPDPYVFGMCVSSCIVCGLLGNPVEVNGRVLRKIGKRTVDLQSSDHSKEKLETLYKRLQGLGQRTLFELGNVQGVR